MDEARKNSPSKCTSNRQRFVFVLALFPVDHRLASGFPGEVDGLERPDMERGIPRLGGSGAGGRGRAKRQAKRKRHMSREFPSSVFVCEHDA